jgi:hypothetical protein
MRLITLLTAATLIVSSAAMAQNGSGGNGDSPQNQGSTGWTGAHPDTGGSTPKDPGTQGSPKNTTTGQAVTVHDDAETKDQPVMATGEDLKGPPTQFAPSKTPE